MSKDRIKAVVNSICNQQKNSVKAMEEIIAFFSIELEDKKG